MFVTGYQGQEAGAGLNAPGRPSPAEPKTHLTGKTPGGGAQHSTQTDPAPGGTRVRESASKRAALQGCSRSMHHGEAKTSPFVSANRRKAIRSCSRLGRPCSGAPPNSKAGHACVCDRSEPKPGPHCNPPLRAAAGAYAPDASPGCCATTTCGMSISGRAFVRAHAPCCIRPWQRPAATRACLPELDAHWPDEVAAPVRWLGHRHALIGVQRLQLLVPACRRNQRVREGASRRPGWTHRRFAPQRKASPHTRTGDRPPAAPPPRRPSPPLACMFAVCPPEAQRSIGRRPLTPPRPPPGGCPSAQQPLGP